MPTIAEKARAEAEQTEAEEQEGEPNEEPAAEPNEEPAAEPNEEPAAEPEPHPGEGLEEPSDAMIAELRAACDEHHDHVHAIMGPFVDGFVTCETCNGIGLAYPTPAVRKLKPRQGAVECSVCGGEGELELPTKREQFKIEQCTNCNGRGWVGQGNMPPQAVAQQAVESYPGEPGATVTQLEPPQQQSTDPRVQQLQSEGYIVLPKPNA